MDDKIINFPGGKRPRTDGRSGSAPAAGASGPLPAVPDGLSEDQRKAMHLVLSGVSFVMIGIKPTSSGADFFTAVHGAPEELRNAQDHLPGVIDRAFSRKGL